MDARRITTNQVELEIPESLTLICFDANQKKEYPALQEGAPPRPSYFSQLQECFRKGSMEKYALILLDDEFKGGKFGTNVGLALRMHFFTSGGHSERVRQTVSISRGTVGQGEEVHGKDYVLVAAGFYTYRPENPYMSYDSSSCYSAYGYDSPSDRNFPLDRKKLYDALKKNYPDAGSSDLTDLLKELVHREVIEAFEL